MSGQPLPSSLEDHPNFTEETSFQKFRRRLYQEPLIPLGSLATCYALYRAYCSMRARDSVEMNRMLRARIYAQGFTLIAIVCGGMYYGNERRQRREFEEALEQRRSQEKRDAWLRELEIRDKEDRDWRERHAAIEAAAKEAGKRKDISQKGDEKQKPEQDAARAPVEDADEKSLGVLDAVRELVSGRK